MIGFIRSALLLLAATLVLVACGGGGGSNVRGGPALPPVGNLSFDVGTTVDLRLPEVDGGAPPHTYALSCSPAFDGTGLVFTRGTRRLQGRPIGAYSGVCDYSVTDARGTSANRSFRIDVFVRGLSLPPVDVPPFEVGVPEDVLLPAGIGGVRPYTYALSCTPTLDGTGLVFTAGTHRLQGRPLAAYSGVCDYSVTDALQASAHRSFRIDVFVRGLSLPPVDVRPFEVGVPVDEQLPAGIGGVRPYTYALSCTPTLDGTGLVFTAGTRRLQGRPLAAYSGVCDYSVTDARGTSAHRSFRIDVFVRGLPLPPVVDRLFEVGVPVDEQLPAGSGGERPYTYALSCTPTLEGTGLVFTAGTRRLQGRPLAAYSGVCDYSVTDALQTSAHRSFRIDVFVRGLFLPPVDDRSFDVGVPVDEQLPAGSGGERPHTYALSCSPTLEGTGLVFTAGTRRLQGRPLAAYSGVCDYSVTDALQTSAHRSFRIDVGLRGLSLPPVVDRLFDVGVPVNEQLPAGSGGERPYTHALSCTPGIEGTGLVFTAGTRRLQGRPLAAYSGVCDYSVTDALQTSAHRSFRIDVVGRDRLTFRPSELFVPEEGRGSYVVGLSAPAPAGGVQITIRRQPGADPDLLFDTDLEARGRQSSLFIPEGRAEGTVWVDARYDSDSEAGRAVLFHVANPVHPGTPTATGTIRVHEVEPAFELPAVEDQSFQVGVPGSVTLPIAARGIPPYRYALSCQPPLRDVGLSWAPATRVLSGTPTEVYRVDCTYSATDARGPGFRVKRRFAVNISRGGLSLPPVPNRSFDVGISVDEPLPEGRSGERPYTYALSCSPGLDGTGLVFTPGTRHLQGRTIAAYYGVCDYSVSDARGTSAHRSFSIDISGRDKLTIRPTDLFVHEGGRGFYTIRLSAPAPSGGVQIFIRKKPGADRDFRIDADLVALGLQDTLYIPPGASEGRVYVWAHEDPDSVAGYMEVFHIVSPEQPGASPATGTIRVHEIEPAFTLPAVQDQSFQVGTARAVTLPLATGGEAPYRYALDCRPPLRDVGLTFTAGTRALGGTPTAEYLDVDCVYSATDARNFRVERAFTVTVVVGELSLPPVVNRSFDVGVPADVLLPAGSGGEQPYTYALSCTPGLDGTGLNPPRPTGLVFTPGTRRLQGRPETAYYGVCDYSVTDARGTAAHRSFSIDISGRDKLTIRPTELFVEEGSLGSWIVGLSAPAPTGGVQVFVRPKPGADPSFRIDADLGAAGLQNTLYIPPGQLEGRVYVHADADDDRDEGFMDVFHIVNPEQPGASPATGTIRVHEVESTFKLPAVADQSFLVGVPRPVTLPAAAGGTPPYNYALSCQPVLGGGLTFTAESRSRVLGGTPNATYSGVCTYSATDAANARVERAFKVTVADILALPEVRNRSFVVGQAVNIQLPSARGDSPPYTYALSCSPTLPTTLVFTPDTRRLKGTPVTG